MAKSIDPFTRKKAPVAPTAPTPQEQANLVARATGVQRQTIPTPPPATKIPGITGNPPLPMGKVVGHISPSSLTAQERLTLEAVGWREDIELPKTQEGLKELQKAIADQQSVEVPLPIDPRTPPLRAAAPIPIEKLPAAKQSSVLNAMKTIGESEATRQMQSQAQAKRAQQDMTIKGMGPASQAVDNAVEAFRAKYETPKTEAEEEHVYEVPIGPTGSASIPTVNTPPKAQAPAPRSDTGADAHLSHCPHCRRDLADPDVPEPPYADKLGFVQCIVGLKPFTKSYPLFNGVVEVTFRTLTTREIDVIYKQTYKDKGEGKLPTDYDYWERLNRYRMIMQLQSFRANGPDGFFKDLPDGYSKSTNPSGSGFWVTPDQEATFGPEDTGIPTIEEWLVEEVLKTEDVFRIVNNTCNNFNRVVSKMEAMVDNSDFWKPTEVQS